MSERSRALVVLETSMRPSCFNEALAPLPPCTTQDAALPCGLKPPWEGVSVDAKCTGRRLERPSSEARVI